MCTPNFDADDRDQTVALVRAYGVLSDTYDATLRALAAALDSRDTETADHGQRVTRLAVRLGRELGIAGAALLELERGALLHDIGKIGVPDAILRKPGPLTDDEWAQMRSHRTIGAGMLGRHPVPGDAVPLVRHHHERWDGARLPGWPGGEAIPLGARIFAVADAFDAMTSRSALPVGVVAGGGAGRVGALRGQPVRPGGGGRLRAPPRRRAAGNARSAGRRRPPGEPRRLTSAQCSVLMLSASERARSSRSAAGAAGQPL